MAPQLPFHLKNPELFKDKSYVDGSWVEAKSGTRFDVVDPGSDKTWASAPDNGAQDVDSVVQAAHVAFKSFSKVKARTRARWLLRWDDLIRQNIDDLAQILTFENGKPLADAYDELDYSLGFTWWFAGEAERIRGTTFNPTAPGKRVVTVKQPVGVVAALVPWNYPVAMVLRKAGAALAAGCSMIVKPSPETPLTVLSLAYLAEQAGFPRGVFNVLTTSLENTPGLSEALCKHSLIKKVTFTGSTRVGTLLAKYCAEGVKKATLELGGNCPFLVFEDADLDQAVEGLMSVKWENTGQSCNTANRVYVQAGVYDKFAEALVNRTRKLVVGHGAEKTTTIGPLTTPRSIDRVIAQVQDARQKGGRVVLGGKRVENTLGYFFEPTIILDAKPEMVIHDEESFAPVTALYKFQTEDEVVQMANNTSMGLASYFFTKDIDRTWRLMENLEAGMLGVNTGGSSTAESPFGGIKQSGYGKESGKDVAVAEYLIEKTVTLKIAGHF